MQHWESTAIYVDDHLLNEQAELVVYDPKVSKEQIYADIDYLKTRTEDENRKLVSVVGSAEEAAENSHAIAVLTEWDEFKGLKWEQIYQSMMKPVLFDGRMLLNRKFVEEIGFKCRAIGS